MGILNVTPDSFSDGGDFLVTEKAVQHALEMVEGRARPSSTWVANPPVRAPSRLVWMRNWVA
jgi:hypothetical protein